MSDDTVEVTARIDVEMDMNMTMLDSENVDLVRAAQSEARKAVEGELVERPFESISVEIEH
jgi:hypothetical protein